MNSDEKKLLAALDRWKRNKTNAYKILRFTIDNKAQVTVDEVNTTLKSISSPLTALNVLTKGMKICVYPCFDRKPDKHTYVIKTEFWKIITETLL